MSAMGFCGTAAFLHLDTETRQAAYGPATVEQVEYRPSKMIRSSASLLKMPEMQQLAAVCWDNRYGMVEALEPIRTISAPDRRI